MTRPLTMYLEAERWQRERSQRTAIAFSVDGQPIPFRRAGRNGSRSFTPAVVADWQRAVGWAARDVCPQPLTGDVCLRLHFRRAGKRRCDVDNLAKNLMDAMNGIGYDDDAQVTMLVASVEYGSASPGVDVTLEQL